MKKIGKNSKKGFTLVELIVVLVILAIMAAMLVPALTGYIDEARKKKDYNAASEVLTAAQAVVAQYYGQETSPDNEDAGTYVESHVEDVKALTGVDTLSISDVTVNENFVISEITVTLNGNDYTWDGSSWS